MENIQCLYLEHDPKAFKRFSESIGIWWKKTTKGTITFTNVENVEKAIQILDTSGETFQIFISDMLFPPMADPDTNDYEKHEPYGIRAIKEASNKRKIVVIGLSIGNLNRYSSLQTDALKAGADIFNYIRELGDKDGLKSLCQKTYELLIKKEIIEDPLPFIYDANEPRIKYIVSEIGANIIKSLYRQALLGSEELERIEATYLSPGMSGAYVIRIQSERHKGTPLTHLLKISRNKKNLTTEIKKFPRKGPYESRLTVGYLATKDDEIAQADDWYAIAAPFARYSKPFCNWLKNVSDKSSINVGLSLLFMNGGLTEGYKKNFNEGDSKEKAVDVLMPNASRQARIVESIQKLKEVVKASGLGGIDDWDKKECLLTNYLSSKQVGNTPAEKTPTVSYMCQCHGDLHSRNILFTTTKPIVSIIIDWADLGIYHWATDYARLLADLLLYVYDAGGVESYSWNWIEKWRQLASNIINSQKLVENKEDSNLSVVWAINWMIENLSHICPVVKDTQLYKENLWELQLALSIEFMRGAYRPELTEPKKVLGLILAADAIECAEKNIHTR